MSGYSTISQNIERMPFLRMLPPLVIGVVMADYFTVSANVMLVVLAVILLAFIIFRQVTAQRILTVLLIFTVGIASVKILCPEEDIPRDERVLVDCKITDNVRTKGRWHRTTAKVIAYRPAVDSTAAWERSRENILLYLDTAYHISLGDRISGITYVNPLDTMGGTSGYAITMRSRGFLGRAFVTNGNLLTVEEDIHHSLWERIVFKAKRVQQTLGKRIQSNPSSIEESGVAMALLTGDKHLLDVDVREQYSKAGVSHILAISGLHLGIIFLFLNFFLSPLGLLRRGQIIKTIIIILLLWAYAFITGLSASVLRSAFMLTIMQLSMMTVRRYNSYNGLFASAFVLILVNPYFIYDISFQMSYLAILTILFFFPRMRKWFGINRAEKWMRRKETSLKGFRRICMIAARKVFVFATGAIVIAIAAQIGVMPLTGYFFGRLPLLNILINPLIMVVVMQIMLSGFIYMIIFDTPMADIIGGLFQKLLALQNKIVEWTASFRFASIEYDLSLMSLYVSYLLIIALMIIIKWAEFRKINKSNARYD